MANSITDQQRQQILALRNKRTGREIAKFVGVSPAIVSLVLSGKHKPTAGKAPPAPARKPRARKTPDLSKEPTVEEYQSKARAAASRIHVPNEVERVAMHAAEASDVPDDVSGETEVKQIDRWIKLVEDAANDARNDDNPTAFASLMAKLVSLAEHRRKATPVQKEDPDLQPDIVETGELVYARLLKAFGLDKEP